MNSKVDRDQHVRSVMALAFGERLSSTELEKDDLIAHSWLRCVNEYQLDPTQPREARILPSGEVREHREAVERFLHVARFGIEQLYAQIAELGYVLLLTDRDGVTVDYLGDRHREKELRKAGLYLGADWSECHAGTCGVGTAIASGLAFTCHQTDHFDATHIDLTCTTSPLFDPYGEPLGVLDISALRSPLPKSSQYMALQLVKLYAQKIETANFLDHFRHHWVLRLSHSPEFVEVDPQYLLAIDSAGTIIGLNHNMHLLLQRNHAQEPVLGRPVEDFFRCRIDDLPRLMDIDDSFNRALYCNGIRRRLFVSVVMPQRRQRVAESQPLAGERLPGPLREIGDNDPPLDRHLGRAIRLVNGGINVLLNGETGTGKEYVARALHWASVRAKRPFIAINCAALPETLLESELFGYAPGAFTGACRQGKPGLILQANGGTLFLDEIGDMPLAMQARLLRVLAQQEVHPLGALRPTPVDLYVMAATHRDLTTLIADGQFREDLYYRLNGFSLDLPALRERSDLRFLIDKILREEAVAKGSKAKRLTVEALAALNAHSWPGNVRELRNVLQFAMAVCTDSHIISIDDLPDQLQAIYPPSGDNPNQPAVAAATSEAERLLLQSLQQHQWNVTRVAKALGVSRMTIYRRMETFGLVPPNRRESQ